MYNYTISHHGILGMKWGVRRYRNKDGSLTKAGKSRLVRDEQEALRNGSQSKVKPNPDKWVREDLNKKKKVVALSDSLVREIKKTVDPPHNRKEKLDLSNMTDQELRSKITRASLERQYSDLFAKPEAVSKGRKYISKTLDAVGTGLGVTGSALGIALAIKELKS